MASKFDIVLIVCYTIELSQVASDDGQTLMLDLAPAS